MRPLTFAALLLMPPAAFSANQVEQAEEHTFSAVDHHRQSIYHSPQKPGFTSWVGAWTMPDGSLIVSFTQATPAMT